MENANANVKGVDAMLLKKLTHCLYKNKNKNNKDNKNKNKDKNVAAVFSICMEDHIKVRIETQVSKC